MSTPDGRTYLGFRQTEWPRADGTTDIITYVVPVQKTSSGVEVGPMRIFKDFWFAEMTNSSDPSDIQPADVISQLEARGFVPGKDTAGPHASVRRDRQESLDEPQRQHSRKHRRRRSRA